VNQLSYLVLKCFGSVFAKNRVLKFKKFIENNMNHFLDWQKQKSEAEAAKRPGGVRRRMSGFNMLEQQKPKKAEVMEVSWAQMCDEICDILDGTIPVLATKLVNSGKDNISSQLSFFFFFLKIDRQLYDSCTLVLNLEPQNAHIYI
jgi:hypothetical protein